MHDIIPHLQRIELLNGKAFTPIELAPDPVPLIAVENLMIRIKTLAGHVIDKTCMERNRNRSETNVFLSDRIENISEPFDLGLVLRQEIGLVSLLPMCLDIFGQQLELLVELGLRSRHERNGLLRWALRNIIFEQHESALFTIPQKLLPAGNPLSDLLGMLRIAEHFRPDLIEAFQRIGPIGHPIGHRTGKFRKSPCSESFRLGTISTSSSFPVESWVEISNGRIESISSPKKSIR